MDAPPVADRDEHSAHRHHTPNLGRKDRSADGHARPAHRHADSGGIAEPDAPANTQPNVARHRRAYGRRRIHGHCHAYGHRRASGHYRVPATLSPSVAEGTPYARVREGPLLLRVGPNQNQPTVSFAQAGQTFTVTARSTDNAWLQVCCVNNEPAWLAAQHVVFTGTLTALPVKP